MDMYNSKYETNYWCGGQGSLAWFNSRETDQRMGEFGHELVLILDGSDGMKWKLLSGKFPLQHCIEGSQGTSVILCKSQGNSKD